MTAEIKLFQSYYTVRKALQEPTMAQQNGEHNQRNQRTKKVTTQVYLQTLAYCAQGSELYRVDNLSVSAV